MPIMPLMCILSCVCVIVRVFMRACVCAHEYAYVCNCALACVAQCACVLCATLHLCIYYYFLNEMLGVLIQRKLTVCFRVLRATLINRNKIPHSRGNWGDR